MSLITCCPACGTKFRVVADQLRISEGWVRCGRCQEVFDATQALQETTALESSVPVDPMVEQGHQTAAVVQSLPEPEPEPEPASMQSGYELPVPPDVEDESWLDAPVEDSVAVSSIAQRLHSATEPKEPSFTDEAWEPAQPLQAEEIQAVAWSQALSASAVAHEVSAAVSADGQDPAEVVPHTMGDETTQDEQGAADAPLPSFVKQAQRKAWWSQPAVRFVMGMLVIFLPLTLLLQIAIHERNTLVAWKPQWRPAFESMCVALRCEIAPRKSIASVVLTGSSFNQDEQPNRYRLGLSIQNQAPTAVATPAVELTLTDTQDQVLVRKVFNPTDIGAPAELAARSEWNGTLPVQTQGLHLTVSGYRVMAFYP